jgi:hypothetical protein
MADSEFSLKPILKVARGRTCWFCIQVIDKVGFTHKLSFILASFSRPSRATSDLSLEELRGRVGSVRLLGDFSFSSHSHHTDRFLESLKVL